MNPRDLFLKNEKVVVINSHGVFLKNQNVGDLVLLILVTPCDLFLKNENVGVINSRGLFLEN